MNSTNLLPQRPRSKFSLRQREERDFYLFIGLWLIGFVLFTAGPIIASLVFSFTNWTGLTTQEWIGLENYRKLLLEDKLFWVATQNTFFYSFGSVTLGTLGALFVALLLNQKLPGTTLMRVLYYIPSIASGVAVSILWIWMFNPQVGLVNYLLSLIGIQGPMWLGSPQWALPALIIKSTWAIGGNMIILLAGLQAIPTSLYEAAKIDGASEYRIYWQIVMPIVKPAWLTLIIFSMQNLWTNGSVTSHKFIYSEQLKTVDYVFGQIAAGGLTRTGPVAAVTLLMMIVPITIFIVTQSNIIQTMSTSGLKD